MAVCVINFIPSILTEYLKQVEQVIAEVSLGENNVTIGIFKEDLPYSMYHHNISFEIMVTPQATVTATNGGVTVTLSYKMQYNLTILGSICGYTSSVTLSYGKLIFVVTQYGGYLTLSIGSQAN